MNQSATKHTKVLIIGSGPAGMSVANFLLREGVKVHMFERANKAGAEALAKEFAAKLKEKNISAIVFDRNGYLYHGAVKAFADALRENEISL